jgi:outer membrane murein-binding lipoprotein Lpp
MGKSQTARRTTRDRARRQPLIRPDQLQLYKVKLGPDVMPIAGLPATIPEPAPQPPNSRARRAFLIALIAATGVNFGAILGLVGYGLLQAFGVFGEPAIETIQREQGASLVQLESTVAALGASVTGLSAHVNAAGEREDAANRRVAEIDDAIGVLRSGMNELHTGVSELRAAAAEEPWRAPVTDLTASVAKLKNDMGGLRTSIDEAKPRQAANVNARLDRIEQAMREHKLIGPMRGAIEPEPRSAPYSAPSSADGHIITLSPAE